MRDSKGRFMKGTYVGFGFKKGGVPWNKGEKGVQKVTLETLKALELGRGELWRGRKHTEESRQKMRDSLKGRPSSFKGKKHTFEARKRISIGQQGGGWKGFINPINLAERKRFRDTIQKRILERDNYTCQLCGERGRPLHVDHIQSWSEYVELRFDMNNCRTLCVDCHYKVTFGRPMPKNIKRWGQSFSQQMKGGY